MLRHEQNFIEAEAQYSDGVWYVEAFKIKIPFARDSSSNGLGPRMIPGVDLVGHMSQLTEC